jgi:ATP-dependent Clp protease ATP-binding subunit ClpA
LKYQLENSVKGRRQRQHGILVTGSLLLTREFESAYDHSFREAFNAGAKQVEPIHLAVGIFNEPLSSSVAILQSFGVSAETLRTLGPLKISSADITE